MNDLQPYRATCDLCPKEQDVEANSLHDAGAKLRGMGWAAWRDSRVKKVWSAKCPKCRTGK